MGRVKQISSNVKQSGQKSFSDPAACSLYFMLFSITLSSDKMYEENINDDSKSYTPGRECSFWWDVCL